jgi:hypothetical protein
MEVIVEEIPRFPLLIVCLRFGKEISLLKDQPNEEQ